MKDSLKSKYLPAVVLLFVGFFAFGIYIGINYRTDIEKVTGISGKETEVATTADFAPFWKVWNTINEKYPGASETTDQERIYGAISGLIGSLNDPYSVFFEPDEAKLFEADIAGNFSGIGMEVGLKDKTITVISPLKDTPAYKAGLKAGDKILKIDDKVTAEMSIEQAVKLIRGEKGTTVALTILREGETSPREIKIVRDTINVPTIDTELRSDGIFVIRLYSFSANSPGLFRDALKKFTEANSDKLILDLRGNPGGYLDAAISMASWFLPGGDIVVTEDYGNDQKPDIYRSKGYNIFGNKLKFVVLIDGGSASASEILAGALQDHAKAKIVGEQSYGKGSVQQVVDITPDTILKITIAKWLTPNGVSISKKGLTPDFVVPLTKKDLDGGHDLQMEKAVELLKNWTPIPAPKVPETSKESETPVKEE